MLPRSTMNKMEEKELYLEAVQFANKKILHLVDTLISDSEKPPVIILQADEGPYARIVKSLEEWKKADRRLRFRSGILNTYYLPQRNQTILHKEISPVNTFRLIFNLYFGTSFEILEDKAYISQNPDNLYEFVDITQTIRLGTLTVNSTPAGAKIYLDGLSIESQTNKIVREIQPGTHILTLKKENFEDYETTFQIEKGERKTIEVTLTPKKDAEKE
ncbi:PEGA domain-containing protein [Acidobacteriota bacterium]